MGVGAEAGSVYIVFVYTLDPESRRMSRQVIGIFEDVLSAKRLERLYNGRARKQMGGGEETGETARDERGRILKAVAVRYAFPHVSEELREKLDG